jgi:FtsP/CotA-like multicopper oxidase with cupredoxin domain
LTERLGRRRFLRGAGIAAAAVPTVGGMLIGACYDDPTGSRSNPNQPVGTPTPDPNVTPTATPDPHVKIDQDHKKGIEDFLKNQETPLTKGKGNQPLVPVLDGDVKVFNLTVDEVEWETLPGQFEKGRGYNGTMPGPVIRATLGDRVRINVKNNLTESTAVHWHGVYVPNSQDGVGYLTQEPIQPGESYTYEFTLRNWGSHMYHAHHNSTDQVNRGLLGAFIVDPADPAAYPAYDREYILIMNDTSLGYTINGKGFPATDALVANVGERVLVRWMNEGMQHHPMHLHGMAMEVVAVDGYMLSNPYKCDTVDVPPGNRYDTIIETFEPGAWAFHCHVLSHAENPAGFFGLVTVLVVQ